MIRNIKLIGISILLMCSTNAFTQESNSTDTSPVKYNEIGSDLPQVRIETMDSIFITNSDLKTNNHLFFIAFNPTCGHCLHEALKICRNAELFKDSKVIFVANPNRISDIPRFIKETHLDENPDFLVGVDRIGSVKKLEIYGMFPYIIVYDKNHKLMKIFKGDTPIEELKEYLP